MGDNGFPSGLICDAGDLKSVETLEGRDGGDGFRAVDAVGDDGFVPGVIFCDDPKHGLQAADGLADKGFYRSHLTTSCRTAS